MIHLTLPLYDQIQEAIEQPQDADLLHLLKEFDAVVALVESEGFDDQSLLEVAGETISKIAAVFEAKYGTVLEEVRAIGSNEGPAMSIAAFDQYVRQSMSIDFAQYIEPIPMLNLPVQSEDFYGGWDDLSAYQEIEAAIGSEVITINTIEEWRQLLQDLGDVTEAAEMNQIKELSHGEDIEAWSKELHTIVERLRQRKKKTLPFLDLVHAAMRRKSQTLKTCSSELWLTFLLGDHPYELCRTGHDFYSPIGLNVVTNDGLD